MYLYLVKDIEEDSRLLFILLYVPPPHSRWNATYRRAPLRDGKSRFPGTATFEFPKKTIDTITVLLENRFSRGNFSMHEKSKICYSYKFSVKLMVTYFFFVLIFESHRWRTQEFSVKGVYFLIKRVIYYKYIYQIIDRLYWCIVIKLYNIDFF